MSHNIKIFKWFIQENCKDLLRGVLSVDEHFTLNSSTIKAKFSELTSTIFNPKGTRLPTRLD